MDWSGVVQRRAVKAAPDAGRLEHLHHLGRRHRHRQSDRARSAHRRDGDKGWFGWPADAKHEELRNKWAAAATLDERKAVSRAMQENAWNYVPMSTMASGCSRPCIRKNIKGILPISEMIPWWNVEKT